jgi:hypothetical protein
VLTAALLVDVVDVSTAAILGSVGLDRVEIPRCRDRVGEQ